MAITQSIMAKTMLQLQQLIQAEQAVIIRDIADLQFRVRAIKEREAHIQMFVERMEQWQEEVVPYVRNKDPESELMKQTLRDLMVAFTEMKDHIETIEIAAPEQGE